MIHAPENITEIVTDILSVSSWVIFAGVFLRKYFFQKKLFLSFFINVLSLGSAYLLFNRSFYALFFASLFSTIVFIRIEKSKTIAEQYAKFWAATSFFSLGFLKIGCLAAGCCWGRYTTLP